MRLSARVERALLAGALAVTRACATAHVTAAVDHRPSLAGVVRPSAARARRRVARISRRRRLSATERRRREQRSQRHLHLRTPDAPVLGL